MESRRNVELSLLLLALILSIGAYVIVGLVADNTVPSGTLGYGGSSRRPRAHGREPSDRGPVTEGQ